MQVQQIMSRHIHSCSPSDALATAVRLMWDHDIGAVPIVDDKRRVVGFLTDRDACMATYTRGKLLTQIRIDDVMSKKVFSVRFDDDIRRAEKLMKEGQIRRLPVLDSEGRLVGMLSQNDLLLEAEAESSHKQKDVTFQEVGETLAAISRPRSAHAVS